VDPRDDPGACFLVSDKALAIGGGVLEAILTKGEIRRQIYQQS
jgi:xanthine dehydrogenase accessory factor